MPSEPDLREVLRRLYAERGDALLGDPRLCGALLRDLCPGSPPREVFAIVVALEEGVPHDLRLASTARSLSRESARLRKQLVDRRGFSTEVADWTVVTCAMALGLPLADDPSASDVGAAPDSATVFAPPSGPSVPFPLASSTAAPYPPVAHEPSLLPAPGGPPVPRPRLGVVLLGHSGDGKSTILRHLYGRPLLGSSATEGPRDAARVYLNTSNGACEILDPPGQKEMVRAVITAIGQSDAAVLVCSAAEGVREQTREHSLLARALGCKQLIVAVNKMDRVGFSEAQFARVRDDVSKLMRAVGISAHLIPVSAATGDNILGQSKWMPWWGGATLLQELGAFTTPERLPGPLRIPVQEVFTAPDGAAVPVGRLDGGALRRGETIVLAPSGRTGSVRQIELGGQPLGEGLPGDRVGCTLVGIGKEQVTRGDVIGLVSAPPPTARQFVAQIQLLAGLPLTVGSTVTLFVHTAMTDCQVVELVSQIDIRTGRPVPGGRPSALRTGDAGNVVLALRTPVVLDRYRSCPLLGRFVLRDRGSTIAAGIAMNVVS